MSKFAFQIVVSAALSCMLVVPVIAQKQQTQFSRPNVILIMVDDLGFSDLGCYGSEIETPNLDSLANSGLRFTQFYNCAKCETTRATLLSGCYYPEVENQKLKNCITIAEGMRAAGYRTLMSGKWHLAGSPMDRGFEKYFGFLGGATNFFTGDNTFRLHEELFHVPQENFYTTDAFTDYAIRFLEETKRDDPEQPFFLYLAYNAPHYPLHAKQSDVEKYLGKYLTGWDRLRTDRIARQKEMGLLPAETQLSPRPEVVPAWDDVPESERDHHDLMMAAYAGMIDCVDQNIGRLVEKLDELVIRDNTLILFLSDNGACPFQRSKKRTVEQNLRPWNPESYWTYDQRWAHACNTPFREYKQNQHEGGICTPLIVNWPAGVKQQGHITDQAGHLVDIMATCLDVAETKYPTEFNGQPVGPPRGLSLKPILEGKTRQPHEMLFFSFYGKNNALRVGDWKLVNINFGEWELYNLAEDRSELNDLAEENPEKLQEMIDAWNKFSIQVGETKRKKSNR